MVPHDCADRRARGARCSGSAIVGTILHRSAIVTSQNLGQNGCIWLHADPLGGDRLLRFYKSDCRLMPLPETAVLPTLERRLLGNDGRYFFTDARRAEELTSEFDPLRHEDRAQVEIDLLRQR
ncbi:MAG: hypothetical protein ACREXR_20065 [Gammaproteobacteria bacterium]